MNEILERVNELNEVLNNGYGVPNMEWVKTKIVELQNVVKRKLHYTRCYKPKGTVGCFQ